MAQIKWIPGNGDFATATNWMGGAVPGPADDAIFQGTGYTVTSSVSETVNSLQMTAGVTLDINVGTFLASTGSGTGLLAGLIVTADNAVFEAGGTIAGSGTISLGGTYYGSSFLINSAVTTLSGGGKVILNDGVNAIQAATTGEQLVNASDTIQGGGQLGNGGMAFANAAAGTVNGNSGATTMVLNFGTFGGTNAGLIEATNSAGLTIYNTAITQSGTGTLKAIGAGNNLYLQGANITGGTLATTTGGLIQDVTTAELNGVKLTTGSTLVGLDNTTMGWDNTINNAGTFAQNGNYYGTNLNIDTATVTLTGGGKLQLLDGTTVNRIYAGIANAKLVNVNNTISGSGQIGLGSTLALGLDNQHLGIINSNGTTGLTLNTPGVVTNEGLIEDTGTGGFGITATTITNTSTIAANGAGSHVDIYGGARIVGGTLATTAGGVIQSAGDGTLDGSTIGNAITITTGSTVQLLDNTSLELNGAIINHGTLFQNATYYGTSLVINTPTVTLSGAGTVLMSDDNNDNNRILAIAAGSKLINSDNTIKGSGQIGNGTTLTVDNRALGIIDSTGTYGMTFNTVGGPVSNEGLIEDTGPGGLGFNGTIITNTGTIAAYGTNTSVNIYNGASIIGGTLATTSNGVIETTNTGTLDGLAHGAITIAAGSIVQVNDYNDALFLNGSIVNDGTIFENGFYYGCSIVANSPTVTLTGGGQIVLADYATNNSRITAAVAGDKLVNVNNIISGSGQIGNATTLAIDNQAAGIIDSNGTFGMVFNTAGINVTNEGLIEATGTGGITLNATNINNTGTMAANGAGTAINLVNGSAIIGGLLTSSGGGIFETTNTGTLDGLTAGALTISSATTVQVLDYNDALFLDGAIVNDGTIFENGNYYGSYIVANSATVTLTGGGHVVLADYGTNNSRITAAAAGDKLVNVNNIISGSGQIGNASGLVIDNQIAGIINSTGLAGIVFDTAGPFTNEGLIEATNTGGITFNSTSVTNTGTIAATGAGAGVNVYNNSSIIGGAIAASGGGFFETTNNGTLDGSTVTGPLTLTAGTEFIVGDINDTLELDGAIVNHGTIFIDATYYGSSLVINTPTVTLSGNGQILLADDGNNNARIYAAAAGNTLVNVDNTILGAGQFGNTGALNIDNQAAATIDASATHVLDINIGGATLTNEGLLESTGSGGLLIENATLTNTGTIAAMLDSGVTIAATTTLTNLNAGGTLTGGTYAAISSATAGHSANLSIAQGPVITDAAHIILSGLGSSITFNSAAIETTLTTITATGELDLLNGRAFADTGPLAINGLVLLNGGTLAGTSASVGATGTIATTSGTGTIAPTGTLTNAGLLQASNGGTLVLSTGTLTSTGTIAALAASTLSILSTATDQNLSSAGVLTGGTWQAIGNGATLLLTGAVVATDRATITLSGPGSVFKSGTTAATRTLESSLTSVASNGVLNLLAGRGFASTSTGLSDTGLITLAGGTLTAANLSIAGTLSGTGAIGSAAALNGTLTATGGTLTTTGALTGTGLLNVRAAAALNASGGFAIGTIAVAATGTLTGSGSASGAVTDSGTINTGTLSAGSVTIATTGTLNATALTATGAITDNGSINLAGGTLSATGGLSVTATGSLSGAGTIASPLALDGQLTATGGILTANGLISGAGTITVAASGNLYANGNYAVAALSVANTGILIGNGATTGAITDAGLMSGNVTGSGSITILATGALAGTTIISSGAISDAGQIALEGGTLSGSAITVTSTGLLGDNGTVAQQVANSGTIQAKGGTLTLTQGEAGGGLAAQSTGTLLAQAAVSATSLTTIGNGAFTGFGSISGATTNAGTVTALGGTLTLAGESGGTLVAGLNATLTSTAAIAAASLTVDSGATFAGFGSVSGTASNAGTITATGGTLALAGGAIGGALTAATGATLTATAPVTAASLTTATGGTFAGSGTFTGSVLDNGMINAGTGTLKAHTISVATGGTLSAGSIVAATPLTDRGTINLAGGTLTASAITVAAHSALNGFGTIAKAVTNAGTITATGGTLTLAAGETGGTLHAAAGGTLASTTAIAAATLKIDATGSLTAFGSVSGATTDAGTLTAAGGALVLNTLTGTGSATIANAATLSLAGALTLKAGLSFAAGSNETLTLGTGAGNTGAIAGFANGTTIDLKTITATGETYASSTHTLTLTNGATTVATLKFTGTYATASFQLQSDGGAGTDITYTGTPAPAPALALADLQAAIAAAATAPQHHIQPATPAAAPITPAAPEFNLTASAMMGTTLTHHH